MRSDSTCRDGGAVARALAAAALSAALAAWPGAATARPGIAPAGATRHAAAAAVPPSQASTFRSRTDLVALQVTVVDQAGRPVPGLRMEDFVVVEEGDPQTVTLFATSAAPLDVMLLLDTSGSMGERMAAARDAASSLVRTLRPGDRAALVLFSDRVRIAQGLTGDQTLLEGAIGMAAPGGGTALHEAVYIALRELARVQRAATGIRRQALVVLSDGEDTSSRTVSHQDVLDVARRGAVTVFTIMPAASAEVDQYERVTRDGPRAEFNLRTLARETGGRAFVPAWADDLSSVYRQITDELGQQYWLAYVAPPTTGGFRRVSVRVAGDPRLGVRTRSGYFAAPARP